jgi:serine/threonine-protein kinase
VSDTSDFKRLDLEDPAQDDDSSFATWLPPLLSTDPSPPAPAATLTGLGPPSGPRATSAAEAPAASDLVPASHRTVAPFFHAPAADPLAILADESFQKDVTDAFSEGPPAPPGVLRATEEIRLPTADEALLREGDEALLRDADDDDEAPTQVISQLFPNGTPARHDPLRPEPPHPAAAPGPEPHFDVQLARENPPSAPAAAGAREPSSLAHAETQESEELAALADTLSRQRAAPPVRYRRAPVVRVSEETAPHTNGSSSSTGFELVHASAPSLSPPEVPTSAGTNAKRPPVPIYPPTIEVAPQLERELPTAPSSRRPTPPRVEIVTAEAHRAPIRSEPPWAATVGPKTGSPRVALRYAALAFAASALVTVLLLRSLIPGKGSVMITAVGVAGLPVENAQALIDGAPACAPVPCRVSKLREGRHVLTIKAHGYRPTEPKPFNIESGNDSLVLVSLTPENTSGLHVRAPGRGLRVFLDGEDRGEAPLTIGGLSPTEHTIRVAGSPLYAPFEQKITLKPNSTATFVPELVALQSFITITPGAGARSASVEVLGGPQRKAVVELPARVEVPPLGTYRVRARRPGYRDYEAEVRFDDGKAEKQVHIDLLPAGAPPAPTPALAKTPSNAALPVVLEETPAQSSAAATTGSGTLNLSSVPASNVIVDGRPIGPTPQRLTLAAGSHSVMFVHPVRGRKAMTIKVEPGKSAAASAKF